MENINERIIDMRAQKIIDMYDNSPDTLAKQALDCIVKNMNSICKNLPAHRGGRQLKDDIIIPAELCEDILHAYQKRYRVNDGIAIMFQDKTKARLGAVRLKNARITDKGLQALMEHKPSEVELLQCDYLSQRSMDIINEHADNLVSLKFGPLSYVQVQEESFFRHRDQVITVQKLRKLSIHCRGLTVFPLLFLRPLTFLTYLDLTEYTATGSHWALHDLKNLQFLILHAVVGSRDMIDWIISLKSLRHLDLSQSNDRQGKYTNPNKILEKLVLNLPHLVSLDISGTNLAGTGTAAVMMVNEGTSMSSEVRCDIPGLVSRVNKPLEFLGLYGTHHGACKRHDIPAQNVTGDANEEQILTAAEAYIERPAMLTRVLNDLYYLFRYENNACVGRALYVVLEAMECHQTEKHIQISGSATLFYIVKGKEKTRIRMKLRNRIITVLLDAMDTHVGDDTMMRNGCLTLCQFSIPTDVPQKSDYESVMWAVYEYLNRVKGYPFNRQRADYARYTKTKDYPEEEIDQSLFDFF